MGSSWSGVVRWSAGIAVVIVVVLVLATAPVSARPATGMSSSGAAAPLAAVTLKNVTVGKEPSGVIYDPANKEIYVDNIGSGTVSAINSTSYKVTTFGTGLGIEELLYSASSKDLYAQNFSAISIFSSANKLVHTVKFAPSFVIREVYDPANADVYALLDTTTGDKMADINHTTYAVKTVTVPAGAIEITYDNASSSLVVSSPFVNEVAAISAADHVTDVTIKVGLAPEWMVYDPNNKDLYITDVGETTNGTITKTGNVTVLSSANKIVATIKVGKFPTFGTYDPSSHDIYEVNTGGVPKGASSPTSTVSIIGTSNTVVKTLTLGKFATLATYDPKNQEMYIPATASNRTYAIDSSTNAIAATVVTNQFPSFAGYDGTLGEMLVVGYTTFENNKSTAKTLVTLIPSSNSPTSTISLGTGPIGGAAWDPTDKAFWAANSGTTTVTVVL